VKKSNSIEELLLDKSDFIRDFQPVFVDYFVNLCISYDKFYPKETLLEVANTVYRDIFIEDVFITTYEKDIFKDMLEDGVMMGFLISRSMFFLLEHFIQDIKKNAERKEYIETIIIYITEYINQFEKYICDKNRIQPLHINFDTLENFSSGHNILDIFEEIKDRGDEVTFFNLYKGIPIQHKGTIVDIDDNEVVFRTMQTQEIAMRMDGVAYILKDSNFDKYLKADIVYNNFANNTVVLNNFRYMLNMPAMSRKFIRVHPEIMVEVSLCSEEELAIKGKLFDLSINGLGVISEENSGIYAGAKINVNFALDEFNNINLKGEVLNIIEYSNSYRYCIKIHPKVDMEEKIRNYVKKREIEIIDSLDKEHEEW